MELQELFFTPFELAKDFSLEIFKNKSVLDLCAGIGMLSFIAYHFSDCKDITCVELNKDYLEVGKKIVPEANWILGSIADKELITGLNRKFDQAISNPPFGKIKTGLDNRMYSDYKGSEFEFITISIAQKLAKTGTFILPQMSTPYKYSGNNGMEFIEPSEKVKKFINETGLEFEFNCGIDTSPYINDWKGVSPMCEIVNFDFENLQQPSLF